MQIRYFEKWINFIVGDNKEMIELVDSYTIIK